MLDDTTGITNYNGFFSWHLKQYLCYIYQVYWILELFRQCDIFCFSFDYYNIEIGLLVDQFLVFQRKPSTSRRSLTNFII